MIYIMKKLIQLLIKPTPKVGKKIRNIGLGLLTAGGGGLIAPELTEVPESWISLLNALSALLTVIGALIAGVGQGQTEEKPKE